MNSQKLSYTGNGTDLAFLMFKNLLLTVLTFGVYAAWGRTNTRRYLWGQTSFLGDRAAYSGKGEELFKGWAIMVAIYLGAAFFLGLLGEIFPLIALLTAPLYVYLYALIIYGGTRYRVAKTQWRGISFGLDKNKESTRDFIKLVFKYVFYTIITLGIAFPYLKHYMRKFLTDRTRFGTTYFRYEADAGAFFRLYSLSILLTILTLGIYFPWFMVKMMAFRLENTRLQDARFRVKLSGGDLLLYSVGSFFLGLFTLGLAAPWIINWGLNLVVNSLEVEGEIDFAAIENAASEAQAAYDVAAIEYDIDLAF